MAEASVTSRFMGLSHHPVQLIQKPERLRPQHRKIQRKGHPRPWKRQHPQRGLVRKPLEHGQKRPLTTAGDPPEQFAQRGLGDIGRRHPLILQKPLLPVDPVQIADGVERILDEAGTERDRQKPALGHDDVQDLREQHPGVGPQDALLGIKGNETIQSATEQDVSAVVETNIPLAAPVAEDQHRQVAFQQRGVAVGQACDLSGCGLGITAPGFDALGHAATSAWRSVGRA